MIAYNVQPLAQKNLTGIGFYAQIGSNPFLSMIEGRRATYPDTQRAVFQDQNINLESDTHIVFYMNAIKHVPTFILTFYISKCDSTCALSFNAVGFFFYFLSLLPSQPFPPPLIYP